MSKKFALTNPARQAYFVLPYYDGTFKALQATSLSQAIDEVVMMIDFELAVDKRKFWQGLEREEACQSELEAAQKGIMQLNGEQVLEHAYAGHGYALRWGWVREV